MAAALITWYIVDGSTPGVIVILWLFMMTQYYLFVKYPRYTPTWTIAAITQVLIIAYGLQVRNIGVAAAERSGQPVLPTYLIGPYRLATVIAGCFLAFIWTIFPSPMTDRTWLRRDLSAVMYLLANYVSAIHESLRVTLTHGAAAGDVHVKGTPAERLVKVRIKIFSKLMVLLPSLETHSRWQRYEPTIGGRFPRAVYNDIILRCNRCMNYLSLMSYTVTWSSYATDKSAEFNKNQEAWNEAIAQVAETMGPTNFSLVSTLTLLSNSMLSGQCLPPYIPLPRPFELTRSLLRAQHHHHRNDTEDEQESHVGNGGEGSQTLLPESDEGHHTARSRRSSRHNYTTESSSSASRTPRDARIQNLLDPRNMEQRGYTGFAVLQVCSALLTDDLRGIVDAVSGLVGVVDFSFPEVGSESSVVSGSGSGNVKRD